MKDLREWIALLEKSGELVRIDAPVDPVLEITEIADRVSKAGGPALLFTNVTGSRLPVLINQFGTDRRMCMALGTESLDALGERIESLMDLQPPQGVVAKMKALGKLRELASFSSKIVKDGPCQEVWLDEPDLDLLPILTCWPDDGGPFVTLPLVFSRDPVTQARNCGMYRIQKVDRRTAMMHWQIHKDGAAHLRDSQGRVPVAVAIGSHPATTYSASAPLPPGIDEMIFAGFLRGKSVEMVRCRTVDLEVPAESEVVLEGYVDANDLRPEGPFGDHTGFYTPVDDYPTFHVTGMSMRRDADLLHDDRGPAADGGLLPRQGHRAALPADHPHDAAGPGRHEPAPGGRVPQLRDRLGQEAVPGARQEADERHLGPRPALAQPLRDRGGPRRRRAGRLGGRLPGLLQRRRRPRHARRGGPGGRARPRGARTSPTARRSASTPRASGRARARCGPGRTPS